jgi:CheY-like chemotaxis protein
MTRYVNKRCSLDRTVKDTTRLTKLLAHQVESGTFELDIGKVDISSVVKQTVKEFSIQARNRKVDLVLSTDEPADIEEGLKHDPDSICVIGDERRLSQCVRNLLSNALKFTAENETVNVTISFVRDGLSDIKSPTFGNEGDDSSTRSSERERAGSIIIQVTDNGVGLSSEQLNLLFNEGVQFNANVLQHGGGSGLGLCLAKEIVEMHSGRIEARSEGLGHGTTFEIELPLYTRSTKEETNLAPTEACSTNSRDEHQLVLVVDDVLTNSKMLVRLLERAGHKCLVASDGEEAIEAFEANQADLRSGATSTPIHTVLMDFEMPRMNGPDATKRLRELGCTAHIFGVTGNVLAEDVALFKASGADYVLYKPINLPAIDSAWQNVDISKRR